MKKFFNFIFLILFLGIISLGVYIYTQNNLKIPNAMINTAVKAEFPIEKSYPMGKIKLFNPTTTFENDRLVITAEYLNDALNDKISGTMTFETNLKYDPMSAKLYLDDLKLISLTREDRDIDLSKKPIIRTALGMALNQLEKKELLDLGKIEKFQTIRNIKIENNKIVVEKS